MPTLSMVANSWRRVRIVVMMVFTRFKIPARPKISPTKPPTKRIIRWVASELSRAARAER